jgi:hypothetical protein
MLKNLKHASAWLSNIRLGGGMVKTGWNMLAHPAPVLNANIGTSAIT